MQPRAAVFCHNGLGDGINSLVLSNNLHLNGFDVTTYQNMIGPLQHWFPHLPVISYPSIEELPKVLQSYDWFFVVKNDTNDFTKELIREGKRRFPDRMKIIYLYPSPNIVNEPYYADCLTDPTVPVAENMRALCEKVMHLPKTTKSAGFIAPPGLHFRKHPKRIAIHPTSTRPNTNWPKEKYVKLTAHLKKEGFHPVFIPGPKDIQHWTDQPDVADFPTLHDLATFLYESGYLIGNDSGLGHLASVLGLKTMTFCRRKALAKLWAPSFQKGVVMTPSSLIPNIRGLRIRDRHWSKFITVNMARRGFERLIQTSPS